MNAADKPNRFRPSANISYQSILAIRPVDLFRPPGLFVSPETIGLQQRCQTLLFYGRSTCGHSTDSYVGDCELNRRIFGGICAPGRSRPAPGNLIKFERSSPNPRESGGWMAKTVIACGPHNFIIAYTAWVVGNGIN
jgi:hypothetical protein